jgi:hypothetical protein
MPRKKTDQTTSNKKSKKPIDLNSKNMKVVREIVESKLKEEILEKEEKREIKSNRF